VASQPARPGGASAGDPSSAAGAPLLVAEHAPLVVVGAGPAGLSAALAAAKAGIATVLVDEHPVESALMGLDVPYHFGQRMNAAVQSKGRMIERIAETDPRLSEAFEAGIDLRLGTCVAGAFVSGPSASSLRKPVLMLADGERSWLMSFDRLIVAAGARDLGLGFAGWEKPGVMGARGAMALLRRYHAFDGRTLLVMGSGAVGMQIAFAALDSGIAVAGIVEIEAAVRGPEAMRAELARRGVPFYLRHAVKEAVGGAEVEGAVLLRLDAEGRAVAGSEARVACDTIVTAIGLVPNVELLDLLGCRLAFRSELGGYVPELDEEGRSSVPCVFAAGDCAGTFEGKLVDDNIARAEGALAAAGAARDLGAVAAPPPESAARRHEPGEVHGYWQAWLAAEIAVGGWDVTVCQCEEVTRRELVELRPPRYLGWGGSQVAARNIERLAAEGPLNQDQVKRLTRAGMGHCQGRRCREQVQMLLAIAGKVPVAAVPLASYRPPVRPLPLGICGPQDEPREIREHWTAWFNIPTQWTPHWEPTPVAGSQPAPDISGLGGPAPGDER